MVTLSVETLQFLKDLKTNNTKEWFAENKKRYEQAKANFEEFVDELIKRIATFDPSIAHHTAKSTVFRIYRDVRFSKDKSPYKTHMGAHITMAHKKSDIHTKSGYYFHIGPGESMLAGGAYMPEGDWLKNIRQEIDYNGAALTAIISNDPFKKYFGELEGESLKKMPKGYPEDHPFIELLKKKSFLATHQVSDKLVTSPDFLEHCAEVYAALKPLGDFLNEAG